MKKNIFYICLIVGLLLDGITKYIAVSYLKEPIPLIGNFLSLELLFNPGIAFGLGLNQGFLKVLTISLILGIFYYYFTEEKKKNNVLVSSAFGLIIAGALGNGIERIFKSEVIDFISVQYFSVFNIADTMITIGAILYIYSLYKTKK